MTIKILLVNVHSFHNAGDAALASVAIKQLKENFPGSQLTIIANDPGSYHGNDPILKSLLAWVTQSGGNQMIKFAWLTFCGLVGALTLRFFGKALLLSPYSHALHQTLKTYLEADLVVSAPGGYFFSYGKGRALLVIVFSLLLAIIAGIPLYMFPGTFGPLKYKRERILARFLLSRVRVLMVREEISRQNLLQWRVPESQIKFVPDVALGFEGASPSTAVDYLKTQIEFTARIQPLVGVTAIDWNKQFQGFARQTAYESALAFTISHFLNQYTGKVLLIPQSTGPSPIEDDRLPLRRIANQLSDHHDSLYLIDHDLSLDLIWALYGQLDLLIGTRMHSNIFAVSQFIPVLAIGYLHKTQGITRYLGIEDWVIDINQINTQLLVSKVDALWAQRKHVKDMLRQRVPKLISQSNLAGKLIAQDYKNFINQ